MDEQAEELEDPPKKITRQRIISVPRVDYQTRPWIRVCEAAIIAGVKREALYRHLKNVKTRRVIGGIEIDHRDFLRYLGR